MFNRIASYILFVPLKALLLIKWFRPHSGH